MLHHEAHVSPRAIWAVIIEELVGLPLLCGVGLTVFLSPHIRRRAAWINVYLAFILNTISSLLLFFANQLHRDDPDFALCLTQAVLMYSTCFACGASVLALSIRVWMEVHHALPSRRIAQIMIATPWIVMLPIIVESLVIGLHDRTNVVKGANPYCWLYNRIPSYTSQSLIVLSLVASLIFQGLTARRLWLLRSHLGPASRDDMERSELINVSIRLTLFCVASISGICVCAAYLSSRFTNLPHIVQGSWPIVGFLIFGCSPDIIKAWIGCFRSPTRAPSASGATASPPPHAHGNVEDDVIDITSDIASRKMSLADPYDAISRVEAFPMTSTPHVTMP